MRRTLNGFACLAGLLLASAAARAEDTIKIGLICPFSGNSPTPRRRSTTASNSM